MKFIFFFLEAIRVANRFGRADYRTDLASADRLIEAYCAGGGDRQGQSSVDDRMVPVHELLLNRG